MPGLLRTGVVIARDDRKIVFFPKGQLAQGAVKIHPVAAVLLKEQTEEHRFLLREFHPLHPALFIGGIKILRDSHIAVKAGLGLAAHGGFQLVHVPEHGKDGRRGDAESLADLSGGQRALAPLAHKRKGGAYDLVSGEFRFRGHAGSLL